MKLFIGLYLVGMAVASPQFNIFNGIRNIFRGGRNLGGGRPSGNSIRGGGGCGGGHAPNHNFGGQNFLISWRLGCTQFTQGQGENFCSQNGMRPISLDSQAKEREFSNLVAREGQRYFWTGGQSVGNRQVRWSNGRVSTPNWSHTGGAGRPQPDNREGNERCVGILNNFYNDGVRAHDISCHHRKPIICES